MQRQLLQLSNKVRAACGPEFISKRFLRLRPATAHPTWGNCYVASEALYHLGAKDAGFKPHWIILKECNCGAPECKGGPHWFLRNPETGKNLDPTVKQFGGIIPEYERGTCCGFLTKKPSNRCKLMLKRIKKHHA